MTEAMIGNYLVTFTPHNLPGVGARVIVVDSCPGPRNLSPADARLYAAHYKIAADMAEVMERKVVHQFGNLRKKAN